MPAKIFLKLFMYGLLLSAVSLGVSAAEDTATVRPELTGHWVLNGKASEFPAFGGHGGGGGGEGGGREHGMRRGGGGHDSWGWR